MIQSVYCPGGNAVASWQGGNPFIALPLVVIWTLSMGYFSIYLLRWLDGERIKKWKVVLGLSFIGGTTLLNILEFIFHW